MEHDLRDFREKTLTIFLSLLCAVIVYFSGGKPIEVFLVFATAGLVGFVVRIGNVLKRFMLEHVTTLVEETGPDPDEVEIESKRESNLVRFRRIIMFVKRVLLMLSVIAAFTGATFAFIPGGSIVYRGVQCVVCVFAVIYLLHFYRFVCRIVPEAERNYSDDRKV